MELPQREKAERAASARNHFYKEFTFRVTLVSSDNRPAAPHQVRQRGRGGGSHSTPGETEREGRGQPLCTRGEGKKGGSHSTPGEREGRGGGGIGG